MDETDLPALDDYLNHLRRKLKGNVAPARPLPGAEKTAAAVLVPILIREGQPQVLYTRRSDRMSSHSGQVAFPGGRFDRTDADLIATALRETHEEVGIAPGSVEILGSFEGRETNSTAIFVTPFVGVIRGAVALRPDPKEVAEIFEVPLEALADRRYRGHYKWKVNGSVSRFPAILYGGQIIWGLTYYLTLRFLALSRPLTARRQEPA